MQKKFNPYQNIKPVQTLSPEVLEDEYFDVYLLDKEYTRDSSLDSDSGFLESLKIENYI